MNASARVERRIKVINKLGLHARAAAKLAKLAAGFGCRVELRRAEQVADAKSIMGVMTLAATQGSEITLVAHGADAERAAAAVCALFADCFGEGE
ncbi:MAG: HPr family phosphocarrier protein [bacterium]